MMLGITSPLIPAIQENKRNNNTLNLTNIEASWFVVSLIFFFEIFSSRHIKKS